MEYGGGKLMAIDECAERYEVEDSRFRDCLAEFRAKAGLPPLKELQTLQLEGGDQDVTHLYCKIYA